MPAMLLLHVLKLKNAAEWLARWLERLQVYNTTSDYIGSYDYIVLRINLSENMVRRLATLLQKRRRERYEQVEATTRTNG